MKRDFILTTPGKAASALSCVALSLLACAQAGAQVAPPQAQGPSGVRVEGAGGGVQGVRSGAPTDWVLQLKSGQISPEEAWNRGLLTPSNTGRVIWSQEIAAKEYKDLRLKLAGLLAERAPEVLGPRNGADRELKRVAGDYFRSQKDERAVAFLEAALEELLQERQAQMKSRTAGDVARKGDPKWITPLGNLAMFYSETGQFLLAAQAWERAPLYSQNPAWLADALVEAAAAYTQAGDIENAKATYIKVAQYGQGYYTGMALYHQALYLLADNNPTKARDLINQNLPLLLDSESRIGPLWALALAQWQLENWIEAEAALKEMIEGYNAQDGHKAERVAALHASAQNRLNTLQEWKTKTFDLPLKNLVAVRKKDGIFYSKLYVHSLTKQVVQMRSKDAEAVVTLTMERQNRLDSGLLVGVYSLTYHATPHPDSIEIQVFLVGMPEQYKPLKLRLKDENNE